jgi:excinuclease ABC subunit C
MFDGKAFVRSLPESPGVYRMCAAGGEVIYVGKAKSLKKRVASYFQRSQPSPRIGLMLTQVDGVEITVTRSEAEALLLENNLIKTLAPRFNILYRDDKSYPYIVITDDPFPRIGFHRGAFARGCRYFGPFPNAGAVRESIQLLQKVFQLRTCENSVFQNRSRPCLLHQIRRCTAPCVGRIAAPAYASDIEMAERFLRGRPGDVVDDLSARMQAAADELRFEQAAVLRDRIRSLQQVLQRQYVAGAAEEDVDIVVAVVHAGVACVNQALVRGGRHLGDRPQFPRNAQGCEADEALAAFVEQHYVEHPAPPRIVLARDPDEDLQEVIDAFAAARPRLARARSEVERAWVAMAEKNAELAIAARMQEAARSGERVEALQAALELPEPPARIECFDISHTMGEATVASCVVFAEGRMQKGEYRRYNIAGVAPGDDYAAMRQVLERRYEKVAAGEGLRPDLILIDGGKGQIGAARAVLVELGLEDLPAVGVAKGEERRPGLEELVFAEGREPLRLGSGNPALHLIQEIRDEAHRFAVAGHRARRDKTRRVSRLEDIPGIGPTRRKRLLQHFGGLQGVLAATIEDLCRVEGVSRKTAERIYNGLH